MADLKNNIRDPALLTVVCDESSSVLHTQNLSLYTSNVDFTNRNIKQTIQHRHLLKTPCPSLR